MRTSWAKGFGDVVRALAEDQAAEPLVDQLGASARIMLGLFLGRARGHDPEADGRLVAR